MTSAEIHSPNSEHPSLSREGFNIVGFMGKWYVVHSTLPLWKNKKDVTITYTLPESLEPSQPPAFELLRFDDIVQYRSATASSSSNPWTVQGVDTLLRPDAPQSSFKPGASFRWRGKGLLKITSSRWQVLGYGDGWAVTFFSKTIFTPAGIDIYSRDEKGVSEELYDQIMMGLSRHQETKKNSGRDV